MRAHVDVLEDMSDPRESLQDWIELAAGPCWRQHLQAAAPQFPVSALRDEPVECLYQCAKCDRAFS
eukprot:3763214-Alexandrium_andersonii.AAC.1